MNLRLKIKKIMQNAKDVMKNNIIKVALMIAAIVAAIIIMSILLIFTILFFNTFKENFLRFFEQFFFIKLFFYKVYYGFISIFVVLLLNQTIMLSHFLVKIVEDILIFKLLEILYLSNNLNYIKTHWVLFI
jgi:hypothetical protein